MYFSRKLISVRKYKPGNGFWISCHLWFEQKEGINAFLKLPKLLFVWDYGGKQEPRYQKLQVKEIRRIIFFINISYTATCIMSVVSSIHITFICSCTAPTWVHNLLWQARKLEKLRWPKKSSVVKLTECPLFIEALLSIK